MRWILAFMCMLSPVFAEAAWRHYENPRFGFMIDVPAGLIEGAAPDNGDGATFTAADGSSQLLVWGGYLVDKTLKEDLSFRRGEEQKDGWTISYAPLKRGWYVYSGTKGDRIVYAKTVTACRGELALYFRMEYPKAEKSQYDAMVTRLSKSLKSSKGSDCS